MRISARGDYAVRACLELAVRPDDAPLSAEAIATGQDIPRRFLEGILPDLRRADIILSQRGARGGHRLARAPEDVTVADVIRAVEGPLVYVRDDRPSDVELRGTATPLVNVWVALRANVRAVLESVTLADLADGRLPNDIANLVADPGAWEQE
ncbi:transcriptional regulator [Microbacterium faecale]|uniref:Transcriptional regulator n=1 Tax=Microbacterium faecale TaxID=1804630 RepID=A0A916Y4W4_9MICO|nr:Rrf2 family transcriptional regulator [Microbacterium faecale]GGD31340.1 transcriptional regulator [Microbacterium faecale]